MTFLWTLAYLSNCTHPLQGLQGLLDVIILPCERPQSSSQFFLKVSCFMISASIDLQAKSEGRPGQFPSGCFLSAGVSRVRVFSLLFHDT